jgi:hypothetical protein
MYVCCIIFEKYFYPQATEKDKYLIKTSRNLQCAAFLFAHIHGLFCNKLHWKINLSILFIDTIIMNYGLCKTSQWHNIENDYL